MFAYPCWWSVIRTPRRRLGEFVCKYDSDTESRDTSQDVAFNFQVSGESVISLGVRVLKVDGLIQGLAYTVTGPWFHLSVSAGFRRSRTIAMRRHFHDW